MTQPLSQCDAAHDQQRVFSLCTSHSSCFAVSLCLRSAVWMLQSPGACMNEWAQGDTPALTLAFCMYTESLLFSNVKQYRFAYDLLLFVFLTSSFAQRGPEFWEGLASTVVLYYLWYLRGLPDSTGEEWSTNTVTRTQCSDWTSQIVLFACRHTEARLYVQVKANTFDQVH